jgi:hypothetical protein
MKKWSLILFAAGILSGLILIALATWADQEAALFEPTSAYDKGLPSLHCPLIVTGDEVSSIFVDLKNPSTYPVSPLTTAHITAGSVLLIDEFVEIPSLLPGGKITLSWKVIPADAAYHSLILSRVFVERSYPLPSRTGSCGIVVLPFGRVPGGVLVGVLAVFCLLGTILGLVFWCRANPTLSSKQREFHSGLIALAAITAAGLLSIQINIWLIGLASVIGILLLSIALVPRYWGEV